MVPFGRDGDDGGRPVAVGVFGPQLRERERLCLPQVDELGLRSPTARERLPLVVAGRVSARTLIGGGIRPLGSRTFDGRIQLVEYVPTVLAGPPGTNKVKA